MSSVVPTTSSTPATSSGSSNGGSNSNGKNNSNNNSNVSTGEVKGWKLSSPQAVHTPLITTTMPLLIGNFTMAPMGLISVADSNMAKVFTESGGKVVLPATSLLAPTSSTAATLIPAISTAQVSNQSQQTIIKTAAITNPQIVPQLQALNFQSTTGYHLVGTQPLYIRPGNGPELILPMGLVTAPAVQVTSAPTSTPLTTIPKPAIPRPTLSRPPIPRPAHLRLPQPRPIQSRPQPRPVQPRVLKQKRIGQGMPRPIGLTSDPSTLTSLALSPLRKPAPPPPPPPKSGIPPTPRHLAHLTAGSLSKKMLAVSSSSSFLASSLPSTSQTATVVGSANNKDTGKNVGGGDDDDSDEGKLVMDIDDDDTNSSSRSGSRGGTPDDEQATTTTTSSTSGIASSSTIAMPAPIVKQNHLQQRRMKLPKPSPGGGAKPKLPLPERRNVNLPSGSSPAVGKLSAVASPSVDPSISNMAPGHIPMDTGTRLSNIPVATPPSPISLEGLGVSVVLPPTARSMGNRAWLAEGQLTNGQLQQNGHIEPRPLPKSEARIGIVRPHVLNHYIDGFIICEGPEPFPLTTGPSPEQLTSAAASRNELLGSCPPSSNHVTTSTPATTFSPTNIIISPIPATSTNSITSNVTPTGTPVTLPQPPVPTLPQPPVTTLPPPSPVTTLPASPVTTLPAPVPTLPAPLVPTLPAPLVPTLPAPPQPIHTTAIPPATQTIVIKSATTDNKMTSKTMNGSRNVSGEKVGGKLMFGSPKKPGPIVMGAVGGGGAHPQPSAGVNVRAPSIGITSPTALAPRPHVPPAPPPPVPVQAPPQLSCTSFRNTPPGQWTVSHVGEFIASIGGCEIFASLFLSEEIDGHALLLLKEDHLMQGMNIKLGPALKICAAINELRRGAAL